ncbi:hypothetical protein P6F26_05595 [Roseibacterium sp. SDUM158017]|uniref:hypothetical protein n=1 Tax=Roseicyclus salinarum TaxID=3036773 RepID=UPI0024154EFC|nr:hypothetical protein [Roseibacterium sp. SDUM158017]MDG4647910.1 hypothetical protein [Roseibacterium sp. SDUM158017]
MRSSFTCRVIRAVLVIGVLVPVLATVSLYARWGPDLQDAESASPDWIKGPADLEMREDLVEIYACMRARAEEQMVSPLEQGSLPDRRLISAINKAAADWEITGQPVYEVELPFFDTNGVDPVHLEFRLTEEEFQNGRCL